MAGQATLLEPCVLLTLFHMATVAGMIAVLGVERFEEARGDAVVATGHGVAFLARAAGDVLGVDVGRQRVVAGLATDAPVRRVVEHDIHLLLSAGRLNGDGIADNFADLLDIADAFGLFVIGGESGDTQETGHGKGQEFLSHVYNSGC